MDTKTKGTKAHFPKGGPEPIRLSEESASSYMDRVRDWQNQPLQERVHIAILVMAMVVSGFIGFMACYLIRG